MESVVKILRVQTSPRGENSESRKLGDHLIAKAKRIDLAVTTIVRDLSTGVAAGKGRLMH
jgi:FMN-dependent NADH-azoreductase